ncbi:hypothetical protein [Fredinandcohnia sp. 179-A 10B2 NHS]|uniref:hypothetical protein n=1 Tax=Fredinandcohnia sp. 179-A 10B2 NHS TaxID=3235176 RepID=UPI00399F9E03
MKKRKLFFIGVPLLLALLYTFTYLPHNVIKIEPEEVSKITIFDGSSGYDIEITDKDEINHIITNLNNVIFKKGKISAGYLGYRFNTTIYDEQGEPLQELIINAEDTIRYKGFFYTTHKNTIDYDYIDELFAKQDKQ